MEPLEKKLLRRHALGGDFGGLSLDFGYQRMMNKREKVHCLQGAHPVLPQGEGPPRGNSREFFPSSFFWFQIFGRQHVYEPKFAHFLGDFQLDILLTVLMNLQKQKNVLILGGDRS